MVACRFYVGMQRELMVLEWLSGLFAILFIFAFAEALGGAATGKNDSFTEGIIYDNNNNIADNFPNEFVLAANIDGEPHDEDFDAKCK